MPHWAEVIGLCKCGHAEYLHAVHHAEKLHAVGVRLRCMVGIGHSRCGCLQWRQAEAAPSCYRCHGCGHWSMSHHVSGKCLVNYGECPCEHLRPQFRKWEVAYELEQILNATG